MSAKLATLGLFKIKAPWNKEYDVIISVHDVTKNILSLDSNYIVDVIMWPEFGNSSISMKEVIITSILYEFVLENQFFLRDAPDSSSTIWTGTRYGLEIFYQPGKRIKTKSQKGFGGWFLGL